MEGRGGWVGGWGCMPPYKPFGIVRLFDHLGKLKINAFDEDGVLPKLSLRKLNR